jgi:hypothetical protein
MAICPTVSEVNKALSADGLAVVPGPEGRLWWPRHAGGQAMPEHDVLVEDIRGKWREEFLEPGEPRFLVAMTLPSEPPPDFAAWVRSGWLQFVEGIRSGGIERTPFVKWKRKEG